MEKSHRGGGEDGKGGSSKDILGKDQVKKQTHERLRRNRQKNKKKT